MLSGLLASVSLVGLGLGALRVVAPAVALFVVRRARVVLRARGPGVAYMDLPLDHPLVQARLEGDGAAADDGGAVSYGVLLAPRAGAIAVLDELRATGVYKGVWATMFISLVSRGLHTLLDQPVYTALVAQRGEKTVSSMGELVRGLRTWPPRLRLPAVFPLNDPYYITEHVLTILLAPLRTITLRYMSDVPSAHGGTAKPKYASWWDAAKTAMVSDRLDDLVFDLVHHVFLRYFVLNFRSPWLNTHVLLSYVVSGIISSLACHPLDTIRIVLARDGEQAPEYKGQPSGSARYSAFCGIADAWRDRMTEYGPAGLFHGYELIATARALHIVLSTLTGAVCARLERRLLMWGWS
ncbi:uncharacterized protein AMSG_08357 [Thecamonas trahens ATCC 50062]|uniref:Uncharacterized protein n=1 Tax=Thecamonas trahens ATCC 50062 TaxID=461836 RepID=A0A0L0DJK1_THETB|nr:hypothetical protein AMSG_08357 [Thecamonas trahens ATCC 50062]KNC52385.1 hypothetical protein AMSG_08357 [Thecamonas trahens ATCC 50062]|eukprot:XP_013755430.1 hypothetical protein AMSG_08357 [Thecamonas trahens ATCC 50062]